MTDQGAPSPWEHFANLLDPPLNPYLNDPVGWVHDRLGEFMWSKQRRVAELVRDNRYVAVPSCHDSGKARPLDALVPTPEGWVKMGDLRPGSELFDEQGQTCQVVSVSPIWNEPCFRVRFSDGAVEVVNGAHEWTVLDLQGRQRKVADWRDRWDEGITLSTVELMKTGLTVGGQNRWRVPLNRPLVLPEVDLTIHPYVLGAWLGDGTACRAEITCHPSDREIVDRIAELGESIRRREAGKYSWVLTGPVEGRERLRIRLKTLGVLSNKHIPMQYLRASREQRLELLRGFMDTDGYINTKLRTISIDQCSRRLADDLAELIRSLGWKVQVREASAAMGGYRYRLCFRPDENPFHLQRKAAIWNQRCAQGSKHTIRTITAIESVESVPTVCIEVDSSRHLYLAGEWMIPTHNSFSASRLASWWLDVHDPGEAFVVTTAPTTAQVEAILWREIGKAHRKGDLPGRITLDAKWYLGQELVAYGRKPADYDQAAFQGIHAKFVLIIIDEADGVPKSLFDAVDALATNVNARVLAIGNPDNPASHFATVCKPGSGWVIEEIDGLETPNLTKEAVEPFPQLAAYMESEGIPYSTEAVPDYLRELLISAQWIDERIRRWGVNSPIFISKVRGRFPNISDDTLIHPKWIKAAQERYIARSRRPNLGVDVARFGKDKTVIYNSEGGWLRKVAEYSSEDTMATAGRVVRALRDHTAPVFKDLARAVVDVIGVGSGVFDRLIELGENVTAFNGSHAAFDSETFANRRAEIYWNLRDEFERGEIDIDPNDDLLAAQLGAIKWKVKESKGRIQIESKAEMTKRGLPSPDHADAAVYSRVRGAAVSIDVDQHKGETLTGDLLERGW